VTARWGGERGCATHRLTFSASASVGKKRTQKMKRQGPHGAAQKGAGAVRCDPQSPTDSVRKITRRGGRVRFSPGSRKISWSDDRPGIRTRVEWGQHRKGLIEERLCGKKALTSGNGGEGPSRPLGVLIVIFSEDIR